MLVRLSTHHVANPEFLVQRDGLAGVVERRLIIARLKRNLRRKGVGHRILRIELARATHGCQCLAVPPRLRERVAERRVRPRIPWIEIDRPPECRLRRRPVPFEYPVQISKCVVSLGEIGVGADGPLRGVSGARPHLERSDVAVDRAGRMCGCQRRPGQRVLWIERRRAFVVLDRLLGRRRRALVGEGETAKVLIVRRGHSWFSPRQCFEPLRRKTEPDLLRDRRAELLLQPEHAGELAVVELRPHLDLIARTNQLGRDAHAAALGANGAFQKVVGAELAPDLGEGLGLTFGERGGDPADDAEPVGVDLPEPRDDLLGQAVGQVRSIRIATEVLERQDGDGHADGGASRPSSVHAIRPIAIATTSNPIPMRACVAVAAVKERRGRLRQAVRRPACESATRGRRRPRPAR